MPTEGDKASGLRLPRTALYRDKATAASLGLNKLLKLSLRSSLFLTCI